MNTKRSFSLRDTSKRDMAVNSSGCDFYSGWIAGMAGLVVGHPIDTLKVRQQIQGKRMLESTLNIYRAGGILTFFRGMGVPLLTTGALNSVYFGFYGTTLDYLTQRRAGAASLLKREEGTGIVIREPIHHLRHKNKERYLDYFLAGCVGGAAQLLIACPVDLVKVQLQSQMSKNVMKGPVECIIKIVRTKGPFGLYQGFFAQAWRDIPSFGNYIVMYEFFKRRLNTGHEPSKSAQFVAGGIAGTISWWSIIPLDVIKSRLQGQSADKPQYKGIIHCGSVILRTHGVPGLFRGFWPLSLRAFPVNGTTFLVYEYLFGHCKQYENRVYLTD